MVNMQPPHARARNWGVEEKECGADQSRHCFRQHHKRTPLLIFAGQGTPLCLRWTTQRPKATVVHREASTAISTFSGCTFSSCELITSGRFGSDETLIDSLHSTFVPLVFSAIFYASNGENYVSYTDALFICVSSATVTGLATIDLSSLTIWQQVLTFILMFLGSPVS